MPLPNTPAHVSSRPEAHTVVIQHRQHGVSNLACAASFPWRPIDPTFVRAQMHCVSIAPQQNRPAGCPAAHVFARYVAGRSRIKHEKQQFIASYLA